MFLLYKIQWIFWTCVFVIFDNVKSPFTNCSDANLLRLLEAVGLITCKAPKNCFLLKQCLWFLQCHIHLI
jgi:hypothetical protein